MLPQLSWSSLAKGAMSVALEQAHQGERKTELIAGHPVGRTAPAEDVADLITYLCREETGLVTRATYDGNRGPRPRASGPAVPDGGRGQVSIPPDAPDAPRRS